ncbi:MAG: winged helix-turn-helix domain-containing protein [Pseudomonadota bacterium]
MTQLRIGTSRVNFASLVIEGESGRISVEPKVLEVLKALIDANGDVVTREDLIDQVWGVGFGGDERLSRAISLLRKAFGDTRGNHQHIETISKRGYRLIAPVADAAPAPRLVPETAVTPAVFDPPTHSIAVLPFANMSADGAGEHFADGMTEELLNALTQIGELQVIGRTSSFAFKGKNVDIREIGEALGVAHVIEGSVRVDGEQLRITAQLVGTRDGYHSWSETYDEAVSDLFIAQEKVANAIAMALADILEFPAPKPLEINLTQSREAYEAFVKGREYSSKVAGDNLAKAVEWLDIAVAHDPQFGEAWAYLCIAHTSLPEFIESADFEKHYAAAKLAAEHAQRLIPGTALDLRAHAMIACLDQDYYASFKHYKQAAKVDPNDLRTLTSYSYCLANAGYHSKAIARNHEAEHFDPLYPWTSYVLAFCYMITGEFEKAQNYASRSCDLGNSSAKFVTVQIHMEQGETAKAMQAMDEAFELAEPWFKERLKGPFALTIYKSAYIKGNRLARWLVAKATLSRLRKSSQTTSRWDAMAVAAYCGPSEYFALMRNHRSGIGFMSLGYALGRGPGAKEIRLNPDFQQFAEDMGLVKIWQEYGWPDMVEPHPGTDGSDLQFTVTG